MPPAKTPRSDLPVWWGVSLLFHTALLTWLVCFSPVKVIDLSRKFPAASVSSGRAREIMAKISGKQAETLSASVREIQQMQQQLAELEARKRAEFAAFAVDAAKDAPLRTEQAQADAARAQAEALAAQAQVVSMISNALQIRAEGEIKQLDALQKESIAAQARAAEAQQRALEKLAVSDTRFTDAYQSQVEATAAQERASRGQQAARAARDELKSSKFREAFEKFAGASNALAQAEMDFASAGAELVALTNALFAAQAALAQIDTNSAQGFRLFGQARKKADSIRQKIALRQSQREKHAGRVGEQKARLERASTEAAGAAPATSSAQVVALQMEAQRLQAEALQSQALARTQFASVKSMPEPVDGGIAAFSKPVAPAPAPPESAGPVEKMDLPALYDAALQAEDALAEAYRRLRATELAMIREVPLARAMELTDSARVARPPLRSALTNTASLETAREAMLAVRAEINAIHQFASSLLAQARETDRSGSRSAAGVSVHSKNLQAAISRSQALELLAAEDETARAKDLTMAMKRGVGGGTFGSKSKSSSGRAGESGTGSSAGLGGTGGTGSGGMRGAGVEGPGGNGAGGSGESSLPSGVGSDMPAMPGRTVAARGESARWMFVDSWYILGPFDNPGRANIDKQFPPETIVDRSAVYDGKGGSRLRWEFYQAHEAKVVPPFRAYNAGGRRDLQYIIYYAATELYFEEECDLWVAIGSDDYSKVWINEQLIWASGKSTKSWRVDEGLRKVHFEMGVNRVLFRVENGHGPTEFSLVIGMP